MRYIDMIGTGGPEVLQLATGPIPEPKEGEVLIKVHAAGINRPDIAQRTGIYPPPLGASPILGLEVAGEIVGGFYDGNHDHLGTWQLGDQVCALTPGGGYAEYVVAPWQHCLPIPSGWSLAQAASLPETMFTVFSNLFDRAQMRNGETLLVHGGSGGIGTTAIQLAKALGHEVYATVSSSAKAAAVSKLGAVPIIYTEEDFVTSIKEHTNGRGVDVILDVVAGDYLERNLKCLADDGRMVIIALQGGIKGTVSAAHIMMRRLTITGSTLRPRSNEYKAKIAKELLELVWPLLDNDNGNGKIKPLIAQTFALEDAASAHAYMESGKHIGKIILQVETEAQ